MDCRLNLNEEGNVISITKPNGDKSQLFDNLLPIVGEEKAVDIYALTETDDFKQTQQVKGSKILGNNKKIVSQQIKMLAESIGATPVSRANSFKVSNEKVDIFFKATGANKTLELELIQSAEDSRGKGMAKEFLADFVKKVGAQGFTITLVISPRDALTTEKGLKKFYANMGFSFSGTDFEMFRKPLRSDKTPTTEKILVENTVEIPTEPTIEEALTFATKQEERLDIQDNIDIQNTLIGLGFTSYKQLLNKMENGLLNNGVLTFTKNNLRGSGIYNDYETSYILGSVAAQENIRRVYQALKNSDDKTVESVNPLFVVKTGEVNSLGKQEILNPFIVEAEVSKIIAGKDLAINLDDIPYDSIKNKYSTNSVFKKELDDIAQNNRNLSQKKIEFGEVVDVTSNKNRELFEKTLDLGANVRLEPIISYLNTISPGVWNSSLESIYEVVKDFNKKAVESGVDFLDIEDKVFTKNREEILDLLNGFNDLLNKPSDNNLDYFFDTYTDFFNVGGEALTKTVETTNPDSIYLETSQTEHELFKNFNLVKESENVYTEIEPIQDVEEAYNILLANKQFIPGEIETVEQLKEYVYDKIKEYNTDDFKVNLSDLENMIIHKIYFNSKISPIRKVDKQASVKFSNFKGDYQYLTKVFTSEFYKNFITEKRKNSNQFKNFYSNFEIGEKGITLKNNDPISLAKMEPYITSELKQYNLLSKNLNIPIADLEENVDRDEMQYRREYAISNPTSVPKVKGDFSVLSEETIAVKNETEAIIKTPAGLYEIDHQLGNVSFYNKLPQGDANFNSYGQHKIKTSSSIDVREYTSLDTLPSKFVTTKEYYTEQELEEINNNFFSC